MAACLIASRTPSEIKESVKPAQKQEETKKILYLP